MKKKKKTGPNGEFIGRKGNTVSYLLNGQVVTRTIGVVTSWSDPQKLIQMKTKLISPVLKAAKVYIELGFKTTFRLQTWSINNKATSENNPAAITGIYPDFTLDYSKIIFSMGDVPMPKNAQVQLIDNALNFTWEADLANEDADESDQIMLLAYFPETKSTLTVLSGAKRTVEQDKIILTSWTKQTVIETYVSYVSDDRNSVSNSVYTGQLIWDNNS